MFSRQRPGAGARSIAPAATLPLVTTSAQRSVNALQPTTDEQAGLSGSSRPITIIADETLIDGNVTGVELRVNGVIKGDVRVDRVIVGESGSVNGSICADSVEVRGRVSGTITAKQVRLYSDCHVDGDIAHEQLSMEIGASFQGTSLRLQRQGPAPAVPKAETAPACDNDEHATATPTAVNARAGVLRDSVLAAPIGEGSIPAPPAKGQQMCLLQA